MRSLHVFLLILSVSFGALAGPLQPTYFGKEIDLAEWSHAVRLPLNELIQNVQRKVKLYTYRSGTDNYPDASTAVLQLPPVSTKIYNSYRRDIEFGQAVGIYMPVEQLRHLISEPTLLLREDTKHWTLIHEYTHHLFHEARAAKNLNLPEGYMTPYTDHFETMQESYQKYEKNNFKFLSPEHLAEYIFCLKVATGYRIRMLLQFELEEMTVETMINQFYKKGKNANFEKDYAENSVSYIHSNLKRVVTTVDGFIRLIDVGLSHLQKDNADRKEFLGYRATLANLKTQALKLK